MTKQRRRSTPDQLLAGPAYQRCPACRRAARLARTEDVIAEMRAWHSIDERPEWWTRLLHRTGGTVAA